MRRDFTINRFVHVSLWCVGCVLCVVLYSSVGVVLGVLMFLSTCSEKILA